MFPHKTKYRSMQAEGGMKNASPSTLVSAKIIEAINKASTSSQSLYRYQVGEDSKCLAACKKLMSDAQLQTYVEERLLR
jgi:hypothetical protein